MNEEGFEKEQLHFAAQDGDLAEVQRLVEGDATSMHLMRTCRFPPLHHTAKGERVQVAQGRIAVVYRYGHPQSEVSGGKALGRVLQLKALKEEMPICRPREIAFKSCKLTSQSAGASIRRSSDL